MNDDQNKNSSVAPAASPVLVSSGDQPYTAPSLESIQHEPVIRLVKRFGYIISGLSLALVLLVLLTFIVSGGKMSNLSAISYYLVWPSVRLLIGAGLIIRSAVAYALFQITGFLYILSLLFVTPMVIASGGFRPPFTDPLLNIVSIIIMLIEIGIAIAWLWGFFVLNPAKTRPVLRKL